MARSSTPARPELTDDPRWAATYKAVSRADDHEHGARDAYVDILPPAVAMSLMLVAEAAEEFASSDHCDAFNVTEFGCTCPSHRLAARFATLRNELDR